jgi:hypothetical protein
LAMVEGVVMKIEILPQFAAADTFARGVTAPLRCCVHPFPERSTTN